MFRKAVRSVCAALLVALPLLGTAAGSAWAGTPGPGPAGSPSPAVRLDYHAPQDGRLRAGDAPWFSLEGMPPGWDAVQVTSPALEAPIVLTPVKKGATQSAQVGRPGTEHRVRSDLPAGTYPFTATSHGRTVATARLAITAEDAAEIGRFVIGPRDAFPGGDTSAPVRPGSEVRVVLMDLRPAPDEEALTVTSPVFDRALTMETGSADDPGCKCDDGGTVYAGHARVRDDLAEGRYTLTVVSHHGQQTTRQQVTVAGAPVAHVPASLVIAVAAIGGAALVVAAAVLLRRRSRDAAASAG